jgi:CHAT domain-containing protein/tetratricopeptide (TPR) repeat protein
VYWLQTLHLGKNRWQSRAGGPDRRLAGAFFLLATISGLSATLYGQVPFATRTLRLVPGATVAEITIQPSSKVNFSVQILPTQTATLTLEEARQTFFVTWTDPTGKTHTPRANRAGQDAEIRFTLPGSGQGAHQFVVTTSSAKRPARVLVRVSALHAETPNDQTAMSAEESLAEGDFLWSKHDPKNAPEALAAYDRAIAEWKQLDDRAMLRRSLEWKGIYLAFTNGDAKAAVPLLAEATGIPDAGDIVQQASAWKTFGFVQTTLADYPDGWQDYAKALALFQQTGDRFNQEVLLENRGKLSRLTGDYDGALQDANAAADIARTLDDQVGVLHIQDDIGEIHLLRGEMQAAFDAYEKTLGLNSIHAGDPMIGFAETDLANLYHQLGAEEQSRDMLARANAFWEMHPYLIGQLATLIQEGKLETDSGDFLKAIETYEHGLRLARSADMKREEVFLFLGLGTVARKRGKNIAAANSFKRAFRLAVLLHESDALAEIYTAQGDLTLSANQPEAAENYYRQALNVAQQSFNESGTIAALGGLAHAEASLGRNEEADQHIGQALDGIENTRSFISAGSLRTAYFSSRHSYYDLAIQVLMHRNAQHPGSGYDRKALNIAERARARFLLDQMEQSGARSGENSNPALAASRSDTLRKLHLTESSLATLRANRQNPREARRLQARVADLLEQEDKIDAAISRAPPATEQIRRLSSNPLAARQNFIAQVQARLDPATALLEYWTGKNASHLWVVTPESVHSYTLPRSATMNALASRLTAESLAPFAGTPDSAEQFAASLADSQVHFAAAALRLGTTLLPPRAVPHGVHTLLVVGDGPLLSVPFEALRISQARGHLKSSVYLQSKYCIVREPSIGVLRELLQRPARQQPMKIALIADPVFSASDPRLVRRTVGNTDSSLHLASLSSRRAEDRANWETFTGADRLSRLSFAGQEARNIASLAGSAHSTLVLGFSANTQRVRSMDWGDYTIAHFATHALLNPAHPELAGVVLSTIDPSGDPQPGVLWFSDISELHMSVEMVVLSACQTANGKSMPGEGLVGISYAFFVAGSRRVVGSLWDVDDQATETLMHDFYTALIDGSLSPAQALRSAQRKMSENPRWSDPYYWAGFTIQGDWRPVP